MQMSTSIISMTATYYLQIYFSILLFNICRCIDAFIIPSHIQNNIHAHTRHKQQYNDAIITSSIPKQYQSSQSTSTSLNVWWFGGTPDAASETSTSGEECELVAVRIDKTSPNSRRIAGKFVFLEYCDLFLVVQKNLIMSALFRRNCCQCLTGRRLEHLD